MKVHHPFFPPRRPKLPKVSRTNIIRASGLSGGGRSFNFPTMHAHSAPAPQRDTAGL